MMQPRTLTRREMGRLVAATLSSAAMLRVESSQASDVMKRKFTMDLCPSRIGVSVGQQTAIELASQFGFESVEPMVGHIAKLDAPAMDQLKEVLASKKLVWGAAGLPVDFRRDNATFQAGMRQLPQMAKALRDAGVSRVGTWIMPAHDQLTYLQNFKQHTVRLRACANVLAEFDLRLGLEYVGPRTAWSSKRYPFLHSMVETRELLDAIQSDNVGFVLDSWHWYTAEEDVGTLKTLEHQHVVAVDLNDAPAGIDVRDQIDNHRELPCATGVIDVRQFLQTLVNIGYDGPVRAEPFNQPLNALEDAPAVKSTAEAMQTAFALVQ